MSHVRPLTRRSALCLGAAASTGVALMRLSPALAAGPWLPPPALPDVPLVDQDGRTVRLQRDLMAAPTLIVSFMFTGCHTVCPPQTALLREASRRLHERGAARAVLMLSITVDPLADGPAQLRAYAQRYDIPLGADKGWVMLTGRPADVARVLGAFDVPAGTPGEHPSLVWLGDTARGRWTRSSGLNPPDVLVAQVEALRR